MAKNPIQFQKGLSLPDFLKSFGTEEQCKQAVFNDRWKNGFVCPECGSTEYCQLKCRPLYQCNKCHHQSSLLAGTIYEQTKLPLSKWFLAIYFISQNKNGISALQLKRNLGISYNAAWRVKHKLMQVMKETDDKRQLSNVVQLDDAYIGGKSKGKRGRGAEGKTPIVAAVSLNDDNNPVYMRLSVIANFKKIEITKWAKHHLKANTLVISDGLSCFKGLTDASAQHTFFSKNGKGIEQYEHIFHWVDTMIGNVKNSIRGTFHAIREQHIPRYLGEFCFRFNNRFDLTQLFHLVVKNAVKAPPMPQRLLKMAEAWW